MSEEKLKVIGKNIDDMLVASIRFRGEYEEIPKYFAKLYEQVKPYVSGKAICLFRGRDPKEGHHLEVCYPVSQAVETEEIKSWLLEGGEMLAASLGGPYDSPSAIWENVFAYLEQHDVEIANDPRRLVYLGGRDEHRGSGEEYVTELQLPLLLPRWLDRLSKGLDRFAGSAAKQDVMAGSQELAGNCGAGQRAEWIKGAMERLDAVVADQETRSNIMTPCAHRFPDWRIQQMRAEYERMSNIDQLLVIMRPDQSVGGLSWYEHPERVGDTIYVTKDPFYPEKYLQATDDAEKRSWYCHCGLVRGAVRAEEKISPTHCYCGAGWYRQLWEGILGKPVTVEVRRSVLQGDDCCSFAIHLPL